MILESPKKENEEEEDNFTLTMKKERESDTFKNYEKYQENLSFEESKS